MAVAKMELVNIIGRMNSLDPVIFACGKTGASQPDDTMSFFSDASDFSSVQEENPFSDSLNRLEAAITRLGGELKTVEADIRSDQNKDELFKYADALSQRVMELIRKRGLLSMQMESLSKDSEQFEHFQGLGINLEDILACQYIKVRFGRLPRDSFEKLEMYDDNPYILFFPGASDAEYHWGVYFAPLEHADEVDRIFSGLYFERLRIPSAVGTAEKIVEDLHNEKEQVEAQYKELEDQIKAVWAEEQATCLRVYTELKQLHYYYSARHLAARYNDKFLLAGWIPSKEEKKVRAALDSVDGIDYSIEREGGDTNHTPPVQLRNPRLFKPFELFIDMYGLPRYSEIDPTLFVAITYTILFGIMFGDLGQGIVLAIAGWLMWKFKKLAIGKVLIPCGISSAVLGVVFGSVFGFEHVLDPLYKTLLGFKEKPIEVMNPSMTTMIIVFSAGIGISLIIIAMLLNVYSSIKRRAYGNAVLGPNGLAGIVFYSSLVFGFIAQIVGSFKMNLLYILCLIVLPLILIFFREPLGKLIEHNPQWKPESWGEYCIENFFELFEALLSYLSNTLSFLRVGAFVLVHAGMMMAVFTLANLSGGIGYVLIVVLGNALVMFMEAFLTAIQVMRLEFYEMFSRYYNGDGEPFKPLEPLSEEKVFSLSRV